MLETNVVVRLVVPTRTTEFGTKLFPVTVSVAFVGEGVSDTGVTAFTTGTGLSTDKGTEPLVPPPGGGFVTAMERVPDFCSNAAGIDTVADVAELTTVATGVAPSVAIVFPPNPVPVKATVAFGSPTPR